MTTTSLPKCVTNQEAGLAVNSIARVGVLPAGIGGVGVGGDVRRTEPARAAETSWTSETALPAETIRPTKATLSTKATRAAESALSTKAWWSVKAGVIGRSIVREGLPGDTGNISDRIQIGRGIGWALGVSALRDDGSRACDRLLDESQVGAGEDDQGQVHQGENDEKREDAALEFHWFVFLSGAHLTPTW